VTRRRLDAEMVRRGLAPSREDAERAVRAGLVTVGGAPVTKAASLVAIDAPVRLAEPSRPFVSRGGLKLDAALERFAEDPAGRDCLDAGASTGGFTDRLLKGGASRVIAVDVGYGQLAWELRTDPRVTILERTNVRALRADRLGFTPSLVVADLSFTSLRTSARSLVGLATDEAGFILLVKPQFEATRGDAPGGVVHDPAVWRNAIGSVAEAFAAEGAASTGVMASPLRGPAGNVEFLLHARRDAPDGPLDIEPALSEGRGVAR
jgi:23S rRNA (cytidine1920-2'-O)/16S rRNA (cytidine1409-2'-O)-methyltransferase